MGIGRLTLLAGLALRDCSRVSPLPEASVNDALVIQGSFISACESMPVAGLSVQVAVMRPEESGMAWQDVITEQGELFMAVPTEALLPLPRELTLSAYAYAEEAATALSFSWTELVLPDDAVSGVVDVSQILFSSSNCITSLDTSHSDDLSSSTPRDSTVAAARSASASASGSGMIYGGEGGELGYDAVRGGYSDSYERDADGLWSPSPQNKMALEPPKPGVDNIGESAVESAVAAAAAAAAGRHRSELETPDEAWTLCPPHKLWLLQWQAWPPYQEECYSSPVPIGLAAELVPENDAARLGLFYWVCCALALPMLLASVAKAKGIKRKCSSVRQPFCQFWNADGNQYYEGPVPLEFRVHSGNNDSQTWQQACEEAVAMLTGFDTQKKIRMPGSFVVISS
ncbi:unnamed protein product [Chrysoparadoxa australica]